MKKRFHLNSKLCAFLFFLTALVLCALLAWNIGSDAAIETVWVAREKIIGAEPYTTIEQVNTAKGLLYGIPVFALGTGFSVALTELYYAALRFFRGENT